MEPKSVFKTFLINLCCVAALAQPSFAQSESAAPKSVAPEGIEKPAPANQASLNELYERLRRATRSDDASRLVRLIKKKWNDSGSDTIDLLMGTAGSAMSSKNWGAAYDLLDQVIALAPQYAEGWNRRATAYYLQSDYGRSISDVEKVLALDPHHFGALSGMATILTKLGSDKQALAMWHRVLKIYPASKPAQNAVVKLEEKLAGQGT